MGISTQETASSEFGTLMPEAVHHLERNFHRIQGNGVVLFIDTKDVVLPPEVQRVYPFLDEAADLLAISRRVVTENGNQAFDRAVDCFSGGGNSMLPMLKAGIAKRGFGIDLNPRAVMLAEQNAKLNDLAERATFMMDDVHHASETILSSDDTTLFIANPPFALTTQEKGGKHDIDISLPGNDASTHLMRAGGRDGLRLTRAYITQALAKAFMQRTLEHAKIGDAIIGVAYSRIGTDGHIELEKEIQQILAGRGTYTLELVDGATLWRGPNGKKEQPNPMPLTNMRIKGTTQEQMAEYDQAAENHLREGYDRLGYFRYIIRIGAQEEVRDDTRNATINLFGPDDVRP